MRSGFHRVIYKKLIFLSLFFTEADTQPHLFYHSSFTRNIATMTVDVINSETLFSWPSSTDLSSDCNVSVLNIKYHYLDG
jgi:hypothetical protein